MQQRLPKAIGGESDTMLVDDPRPFMHSTVSLVVSRPAGLVCVFFFLAGSAYYYSAASALGNI
jgi:hypothetical protein